MVLKADVLASAIDAATGKDDTRPRLLMSPRGRPLTQAYVRELSQGPGVMIICGRFEGVDERVIEARNLIEVSVGDYIYPPPLHLGGQAVSYVGIVTVITT